MDERLDTRRLRYFLQVLESGSVRGAADALGLDASAVSRAIGLLEKDCRVSLLERRGRGVAPTDAGLILAEYVQRQQSERQNLLARFDSIRNVESGHIDIAMGEGFVNFVMQRSLSHFMKKYPKVVVNLDVGSTDEIVQRLMAGQAHIGFLFRPPKDQRLVSHYSNPQPILTWVLRSHPLAQLDRPLELEDLLPFPGAMLHPNFGVRQHIEAAQVSEGVRLNMSFTTSSFSAVTHFVTAGVGYALLPHLAWTAAEAEKIVPLQMSNPILREGRSHVASCRGRVLPPAAAAFLDVTVKDMKATKVLNS